MKTVTGALERPRSLSADTAMTETHHCDKRGPEHKEEDNAGNLGVLTEVEADPSTIADPELEYPANNGLYGEIFRRYVPEIADCLIDTETVRVLVEIEYNLRRAIELVPYEEYEGEECIERVEATRRAVEQQLWEVCDLMAEAYREEHGYS